MWRRGLFYTICGLLLAVGANGVTRKIPASGTADPLSIGSVTATDTLTVEGDLLLGTIGTFTPADTTPDPSGAAYWKTGGAVTITDFDGGSYTAGQYFVLEVKHNLTIEFSGNIYYGEQQPVDLYYTNGDVLTFIYNSGNYWSMVSEKARNVEQTESLVFIGATIAAANDVAFYRLPGTTKFATLTRFSCVASGATVANLDVKIEDCASNLATCGDTGATASLSANATLYVDTTFDDPINAAGRWWRFTFGTVTLAPEILQCEISYVSS